MNWFKTDDSAFKTLSLDFPRHFNQGLSGTVGDRRRAGRLRKNAENIISATTTVEQVVVGAMPIHDPQAAVDYASPEGTNGAL